MHQMTKLSCSEYYQQIMQPISEDTPCGVSLDYDPTFIMLQSRLQPKQGAEYGNFIESVEPINWTEIERECLALLSKSKDIRLIVILIRSQIRKNGLTALAEGTEALHALLLAWPDDLHPQLLDEGEFAPMLRANAIAELENVNGLLADLRNHLLPKAAGLHISVKEFEKAHQIPREENTLSDAAIDALVQEWQLNAWELIQPLNQAYFFVREIKKTLEKTLVHEAPELSILESILSIFPNKFGNESVSIPIPLETTSTDASEDNAVVSLYDDLTKSPNTLPNSTLTSANIDVPRGIQCRDDARSLIQAVRGWFEITEPSSPIIQVLKYAEESIGRNFADLLKMFPPEIVAILNQEKE
ncbi:ImpA family type VI secretion system protein [Hafnia alvei]|uniref:ImpA N-terminal domain-containing protein n=1 Tax=Hafnia alvei TaxID=569 RepID=A0ABD7Q6P8_HAFAL|nr:type VI secretion system ImpA family N-terminal domain-containing protein [Hafnia alvei]TBL68518.1 hypothetical protein EYY96_07485 [Hafnia alvei]